MNRASSTAIVILAAGASARLGEAKQLLLYQGKTLLRHAVETAVSVCPDQLIVVTGAVHGLLLPSLETPGIQVVQNMTWQAGMASSIVLGLKTALETDTGLSRVLIMVSDQPLISSGHLSGLLNLLNDDPCCGIAATGYAGVNGVPAAFARQEFDGLMRLNGDRGAQALFARPVSSVKVLESGGGRLDIDTAEDYRRLLSLTS